MKLSDWTGPIINDKKDSRLFIPKPFPGIGWTFNFGQPLTWVFAILLV
jgi:uncharacterized membrane protein